MVVILVRHAERDASGADALSPAGKKRAKLLAAMLAELKVSSILTSDFARTKQTAAPLATKLGLPAKAIASDPATAKAQMLSGVCVVVGHSDTVPAFIKLLGGPPGLVIKDNEFDRMFILTTTPGTPSVLALRYVSE